MKKYYKFGFDMTLLNVLSVVLFIIVITPTMFYFRYIDITFVTIIYAFLWLVFHELIHGLGFLINKGVHFKNITFGALLEKGILYCMCKQRINKKAILLSLLSPLVLIGIVTLILSLIINNGTLAFLSCMNIAGAIGDIVMFIMILRMPKDTEYTDLDDPASFILISNDDLSKYLVPGVNVTETGVYDEAKMIPTDFRKVVVSKVSMVVFGLIFVYVIVRIIGVFI